MNKKFLKISALISLMLIFSFTACEMGATVESPAQYTVTFNANDGSQSPATGSQTFTAGTAQALKSVSTLGFSRSGYNFAGWATTNDASSVAYTDGASYTATADVTLYAVWAAVQNTPAESRTLSSIAVSGSPNFSVANVFFAGKTASTFALTVTATYSDSSTANVSTSSTITSTVSNTAGNVTVTYTEGGVTKTAEVTGSYYVAASDALTQTVVDNGTTSISGTSFQLVKFGDFPQTIAEDGITYSESTVYNGWYLGSDGYFYEKVQEDGYVNYYKYSNDVSVATINILSPNYLYFKVEPIEWRVLTSDYNSTGKKLLLAEKILTANVPYYGTSGSTSSRTLNDTTIYANNYKYSNIRAYLNGTKNQYVTDGGTSNTYTVDWSEKGFLQKAFTTSAQALIPTTTVDNSAASTNPDGNSTKWNSGENSYACADTSDKIFLLSEQEVTTSAYGFTEYDSDGEGNSRIRETTDYAKANRAFQDTTSGCGGYWWVRSPYFKYSSHARHVYPIGDARNCYFVEGGHIGVCPALSISF